MLKNTEDDVNQTGQETDLMQLQNAGSEFPLLPFSFTYIISCKCIAHYTHN